MPSHRETRHLPWSPEQMFDLVADVGRYAEFLPWIVAMRVRKDTPGEALADMIVGFKGLRETFTSRVVRERPGRVCVDYIDGPLSHLHNEWRFRPDGQGGTLVDFAVDFAFKNRVFEMLAGQMFASALRRMIGAFEDRAAQLYGSGGSSISSAHNVA